MAKYFVRFDDGHGLNKTPCIECNDWQFKPLDKKETEEKEGALGVSEEILLTLACLCLSNYYNNNKTTLHEHRKKLQFIKLMRLHDSENYMIRYWSGKIFNNNSD